jgi:hypothetical protein
LQASELQLVLFPALAYEHWPVVELHVPVPVWHVVGELQVTAVPGVHVPAWQVAGLQASELQLVLFPALGYVHWPVVELHVPGEAWHAGGELQVTDVPPVHTPDWQVSPLVHALASLHTVPLVTATQVPVAAEHV